ncbi:D-Ala-D-Ala carboxypeptidase [Asticcacaulis sp. AC460]|uniref:D-alanyl-D-alanine carboxypeptidase n=1 Tax=Asticcacaulis sp. AC460 TaxID=1282360 RepID=UPI0003C3D810|nr:D-alanyl-D-alanine carboxypeptidase [Asticcacaulis sp. AC460]ESQ88210.1 D-Ala-D-Ala carboxypeptidase [Asticcacaulis sp. AC460]
MKGLLLVLISALILVAPLKARAQDLSGDARYSAIVVDAVTGEVFYSAKADSARYPASLTKIMTLYMAFDALAMGTLKPDDSIIMSRNASAQAPVKVYLKPGETIDVDSAMRLVALYSANDLAVALAEKIGGTEERFAALMTIKAQELGMGQTRFVNASGLPDPRQLSSARDMAILARAVMRDYPQYYDYFSLPSYTFRGRTYVNHNPLRDMPGVDGMKTGFTNAAGYNLVASQVKDGHRLIAVMLGGNNKSQRREHVSFLMNTGFDIFDRRANGEVITVAQTEFTKAFAARNAIPDEPRPYTILANNESLSDAGLRDALEASEEANAVDEDVQTVSATVKAPDVVRTLTTKPAAKPEAKVAAKPEPKVEPKASGKRTTKQVAAATPAKKKKDPNAVWAIQVGAFKNKTLASDWVSNIKKKFSSALADATSEISKSDAGWYRTRFASMTKEQAQKACSQISAKRLDCMVVKGNS